MGGCDWLGDSTRLVVMFPSTIMSSAEKPGNWFCPEQWTCYNLKKRKKRRVNANSQIGKHAKINESQLRF